MKKELKVYKYKFDIEEPFPEFRHNSSKKIFLISHDPPFKQVDELRNRIDKGGVISFFSLGENLRISEFKQTNMERIQQLRLKYEEIFEEQFRMKKANLEDHEPSILLFPTKEHSLFAFIFLDNLGVRTVFAKNE